MEGIESIETGIDHFTLQDLTYTAGLLQDKAVTQTQTIAKSLYFY